MDVLCDRKLVRRAKTLINGFDLVVNGEVYDIITVSIHINDEINRRNSDPFVCLDNRKFKTWFIFADKHNEYIDYDMSDSPSVGGIRINTLKSQKDSKIYVSAGDVYSHIKKQLGSKKALHDVSGKIPNEQSSPKLFLRKKDSKEDNYIYTL